MTAVAHADFERPVLFPPAQFLAHVAIEAKSRRGLHQQKPRFRTVGFMAGGAPPAGHRFMAVLAAGKILFVVTLVAQVGLFHQ